MLIYYQGKLFDKTGPQLGSVGFNVVKKEGNVLFNDAFNTL